MFKSFLFILFLFNFHCAYSSGSTDTNDDCPEVTNLQKSDQGANSITFTWDTNAEVTEYKVWYIRESDGYMSNKVVVQDTLHTFNNLSADTYTFYFLSICPTGTSEFIGIQDIING